MKYEIEYEQIPVEEQETIINRMRSDENLIHIYSTDRRVIPRILNLRLANTVLKRSADNKKLTAIECTLEIKDWLKGVFLPMYKGKSQKVR